MTSPARASWGLPPRLRPRCFSGRTRPRAWSPRSPRGSRRRSRNTRTPPPRTRANGVNPWTGTIARDRRGWPGTRASPRGTGTAAASRPGRDAASSPTRSPSAPRRRYRWRPARWACPAAVEGPTRRRRCPRSAPRSRWRSGGGCPRARWLKTITVTRPPRYPSFTRAPRSS